MASDNLASQVADSFPLPDASLMHGTPTRLLQRYLGQPPSPSPVEAIQVPSSPYSTPPVPVNQEPPPPPPSEEEEFIPATQPDGLSITPPSPPVSTADLDDPAALVSPKLAKLAVDLSSRYRPRIVRPLDPLERGYWRLDCRAWTPARRADAWLFLRNYLRSGLAGWAVWCVRDASHDYIRLYAFAALAKHTYLLLYLASGRQVKATGAQWVDGEGCVALQVPGVERQPES